MYGLNAQWNFFPTSHGNSPCDGIGGTIKRNAAKESLTRPFDNQILTVNDLYDFCKTKLLSIEFFVIDIKEINELRETEMCKLQTIPGTRGYHQFTPINESIVGCKFVSSEKNYDLIFDLITNVKYDWVANTYVTFVANKKLRLGFIVNVFDDSLEADISVLLDYKKHYQWPNVDQRMLIGYNNILSEVTVESKGNNVYIKLYGHTKSKFKQIWARLN